MQYYCRLSIVGSHGPVHVVVKPDILMGLLVLTEDYADMLVELQTASLSKETLSRLKLFLSDYCDESSFENCPSPKEIVEQLKVKLKIDIFNIDTLCACCVHFKSQIVNRSVQQYKKHLNKFLSTTSVKEFQCSLLTDEITCLDDTEPLTLVLGGTANDDTLKNLKKLAYHFIGHSSKAFIILRLGHGSIGKTEYLTFREPDTLTNAVLDKNVQQKVNSRKVRCSYYKEGCEWVGELRDLHDHLDPDKGGYHVACPFGCGKYARTSEMRNHPCPRKYVTIDGLFIVTILFCTDISIYGKLHVPRLQACISLLKGMGYPTLMKNCFCYAVSFFY